MIDCSDSALLETWFPVASSADLPPRHIFQAQLLGQELAAWRADDGYINVWENRCLHRGVRLTLGTNLGNALKCRYHGWLYESETATCTYIPAHPANAPPTQVRAATYAAIEESGLLWVCLKPTGTRPQTFNTANGAPLVLRSIPVRASAPLVAEALMNYRFTPNGDVNVLFETSIRPLTLFSLKGVSRSRGEDEAAIMLFVQPVEQHRSVIHGLVLSAVPESNRLTVLAQHNTEMKRVRDAIEGSGRFALDLKVSAAGPAVAYRRLVAGSLSYGVVA
jgi:nitrite reductase/ring-hydroxylating ferredoxin subunit